MGIKMQFIFCIITFFYGLKFAIGQNLILNYNFDDSVKDLSSYNNDGLIIGGINPTRDRFGNPCGAAHFNGINGYVLVPNSPSLQSPQTTFSFTCWFKLDSSAVNPEYRWLTFICKGEEIAEDINNPQYRVQTFQSKIQSTISINTDFTEYDYAWNTHLISVGKWNHYCLVYDGKYVKTYLNAVKIWEYPYSKPFIPNTSDLYIGRDIPGADEFYSGSLDDLKIFSNALSEPEILNIYKESSGHVTEFTIECPKNITVENDLAQCSALVDYSIPIAVSYCGNVKVKLVKGLASGSEFPLGVNNLVFEANLDGLTKTCFSKVIVKDTEAPVIKCKSDTTIIVNAIDELINYKLDLPIASDNCGSAKVKLISGPNKSSDLIHGENTLVFEANDLYGNNSTCSYRINIVYKNLTTTKYFDCPTDITTYNDIHKCGSKITFSGIDATLLGTAEVALLTGILSGHEFPVGETNNTFEIKELEAVMQKCVMKVTVIDNEKPEIICLSDTLIYVNPNEGDITLKFGNPIAHDNCGIASIVQISGKKSGEIFPLGITTNVFKISDLSGNYVLCSFNVIISRNMAQVLTPPNKIQGDTVMYQDKVSFGDSILTFVIYDDKMEDKDTVSIYYNSSLLVDRQMLKVKKNGPIIKVVHLDKENSNFLITKAWNNGERDINTLRIDIYEGNYQNYINFFNLIVPKYSKVIHSDIGVAGAILLTYQKPEK